MRTSSEIVSIIKEKRKLLGLSQRELAKRVGISNSTLSRYEKEEREFPINDIGLFADALKLDLNYLLGVNNPKNTYKLQEELSIYNSKYKNKNIKTEINKILDELPEYRQEKVLTFATDQLEQENKKTNTKLTTVKAVSGAAAGVGYAYDNQDIEEYYTDKDLPRYDYATVVCGDSMEPNFSDGDIVLIKSGYNGSNGEIHVVDFDGKSFIKKLYHDGDRLRLISTNTKYDPIYINLPTDTYLNIVGKVVGSFTPKKQK